MSATAATPATHPAVPWRRIQFVELEDLPWFPAPWRDAGTSYLNLMVTVSGQAKLLVPKLAEAIERSGATRIVDLCAGGGGPLPVLMRGLTERGLHVQAVVTDLYPNLPALNRLAEASDGLIRVEHRPVDAANVPADLPGLRVIFNAFHHLPTPVAQSVLASAVKDNQPIVIMEVVERSALQLIGMIFAPIFFLLALPFLRPFRWSWVFWTYIIPVLPLFIFWDGVVSTLRIYSVGELHELVSRLDAPGWTWDIGQIPLGSAPAKATYLVGLPPRQGVS